MNTSVRLLVTQLFTTLTGILLSAWLLNSLGLELTLPGLALLATLLGSGFGFLLTRPLVRRLTRIGRIIES